MGPVRIQRSRTRDLVKELQGERVGGDGAAQISRRQTRENWSRALSLIAGKHGRVFSPLTTSTFRLRRESGLGSNGRSREESQSASFQPTVGFRDLIRVCTHSSICRMSPSKLQKPACHLSARSSSSMRSNRKIRGSALVASSEA